jgi:hypothetical protein
MSESVAKEAGPPPTDHPEVTEEKAPGDATAPDSAAPEKKKREYKEFEGEKHEATRECFVVLVSPGLHVLRR